MEEKLDVTEILEDIIVQGLAKLSELDPGSDEYIKLSQSIRELYKLRNENERFHFETGQKVDEFIFSKKKHEEEMKAKNRELTIEEKKIAQEAKKSKDDNEAKKVVAKVSLISAIIGGCSTLASLAANGHWIQKILKFEETGSITTKAFQFIGKIPIFRKN